MMSLGGTREVNKASAREEGKEVWLYTTQYYLLGGPDSTEGIIWRSALVIVHANCGDCGERRFFTPVHCFFAVDVSRVDIIYVIAYTVVRLKYSKVEEM
jgi:hypothetical protein